MEIDDQRDKQAAIEKIKFKKSQEVVRREKSLTKKFEQEIDYDVIKKDLSGFARLIEYDENRQLLGIYEG